MKMLSFRVKIIGTLILGITLFSAVAFTIYNISLKNKLISTSEENIEHINLLRDQYYFSIRQHDGRIIRSILKNMESDKAVLKTYLVDGRAKIIYPDNHKSLYNDTADFYFHKKRILQSEHTGLVLILITGFLSACRIHLPAIPVTTPGKKRWE
ncbi:MAG: hypothetical protein NTW16_13650 [Bacteroidetes bacterium]|nr:hypothetical protein [Bacteroidota bacterium]